VNAIEVSPEMVMFRAKATVPEHGCREAHWGWMTTV
jgi:hypothetical protein